VWNACRRVGFTEDGLDRSFIDQTKFDVARGARGKSAFNPATDPTPRAIIGAKFADLLSPAGELIPAEPHTNRSKADTEAENLRLREALEFIASQKVSLKALGFWDQPKEFQEPAKVSKVTVKSCYGDTLNCGIQELKAITKNKELAQQQKSVDFKMKVADNKQQAMIALELQVMRSLDYDVPSIRFGPGYTKLKKRAACGKLLLRPITLLALTMN
jgi:hypothetical protein